ncbi:hypothetical protein GVX81_06020 [[Haemophilus] felis]|uniref:Uncharacterized protein n=1 Tax=[Haemophilus] felis TaxID=123822 RepID=A0A1T0BBX8_9PAST|nr:hypothetical protein [[Haemophilus] felis]NBI41770.1 hypothetical protein [[Haemophilus] felis]NBI43826.1 hypothetical protein [[Haemophilus] felis]OOS07574.1 hypothetical protein B0188_00410 [[Haemophilus] felis]
MNVSARTLDFFDRQVGQLIIDKYGFTELEAINAFIQSETYKMLIDPDLELYKVSPYILFDLWENEKITGNPRNSAYIRSDNID